MRTNKCTLLIDGNWLLLSRFSVIGKGFEINMPEVAKEHAQRELQELMAKSISIILNRFPVIDNVVLVSIAAGLSTEKLRDFAKGEFKIIRVMPNTPALLGEGMMLYTTTENISNDETNEFITVSFTL